MQYSLIFVLSLSLQALAVVSDIDWGVSGVDGGDGNIVDRTALNYLLHISETAQQSSSERWQDGQLNLLPDSMMSEGFADTVQCFIPEEDQGLLVQANYKFENSVPVSSATCQCSVEST